MVLTVSICAAAMLALTAANLRLFGVALNELKVASEPRH
jgi:hypothetical protein